MPELKVNTRDLNTKIEQTIVTSLSEEINVTAERVFTVHSSREEAIKAIDLLNKYREYSGKVEKSMLKDFSTALITASEIMIHVANVIASMSPFKKRGRSPLTSPPGSTAQAILSFVFSKKAFENVFSQAIIDMREDYMEALSNDEHTKARWIVIRDHCSLLLTVAAYFGATVLKKLSGIWKMIP